MIYFFSFYLSRNNVKFVKKLIYRPKSDNAFALTRLHHLMESLKLRLTYGRQNKIKKRCRKRDLAKLSAAKKRETDPSATTTTIIKDTIYQGKYVSDILAAKGSLII